MFKKDSWTKILPRAITGNSAANSERICGEISCEISEGFSVEFSVGRFAGDLSGAEVFNPFPPWAAGVLAQHTASEVEFHENFKSIPGEISVGAYKEFLWILLGELLQTYLEKFRNS